MRVKSRLSRPRTVISQPRAGQRQWRILDRPAVVSAKELRGNGDERYARDKGSEGTQRDPFEGPVGYERSSQEPMWRAGVK